MKLLDVNGSQAVEYRVQRRDHRRHHPGQHQARDRTGQLGGDEVEQRRIAPGGPEFRILREKSEDRQSDQPQDQDGRNGQQGIDQLRLLGAFVTAGGEQPLHRHLVARHHRHRRHELSQEQQPEGEPDVGIEPVEIGFGETVQSAAMGERIAHRAEHAAVDFVKQEAENAEQAAHQYHELHHVGPDHRFQPSGGGEQDCHHTDQRNAQPWRPARRAFEHLAGGKEHHAEVDQAQIKRQSRDQTAHAGVVAVFKVFERREAAELEIEFHENPAGDQGKQRRDQSQHPEIQPVAEDFTGHHDQREGAQSRHQAGDAEGEPWHPSAAEQVIAGVFLGAGTDGADHRQSDQVGGHHRIVGEMKRNLHGERYFLGIFRRNLRAGPVSKQSRSAIPDS
ncbi:hypothetical protein SDC9_114928 [bioreactor metagenome]|uniref:Uncharacterized protein n=1 Tax=bioreactor metagenome TaxID=1076179 RepID=A0A645BRZ5_9ZZZZ